jgi:hypothetical protein
MVVEVNEDVRLGRLRREPPKDEEGLEEILEDEGEWCSVLLRCGSILSFDCM